MKKVLSVIWFLFVLSLYSQKAYANQTVSDTEAQLTETFCQNSELYAYVHIPQAKENNNLITSALIDNTYMYKQTEPLTKVNKAKTPVSYLFLIDISTSMPGYKNNIEAFVKSFIEVHGDNVSFALATFGKDFEVNCPFTKDRKKIKKELASLEYNIKETNLYSSIISAVKYYENRKRKNGELYNIIIITDGVEAGKDQVQSSQVENKIKESSVMIHTFGLPSQSNSDRDKKTSREALKVLLKFSEESLGVYTELSTGNKKEADLAHEVTDFTDNLYLTKFNVSNFKMDGKSHSLKITFAVTGENGTLFEARGKVNTPVSDNKQVAGKSDSSSSKDSTETINNGNANTDHQNPFALKVLCIPVYVLIFLSVIIISLIVFIVLHGRKLKKRLALSKDLGIFMKADIISQNCKIKKNEFYLMDELIIGRARDCDIRLNNKDVSKRNSRLYLRDNTIYIEDLKSTNGTTINNMKIYSPNKLRSGDMVSIGSVKLILKF